MNGIRIAILFTTVMTSTGCAVVTVGTPPMDGGKVAVCHKGKKTLYIDEAAVDAHLRHGDYIGPCR